MQRAFAGHINRAAAESGSEPINRFIIDKAGQRTASDRGEKAHDKKKQEQTKNER